MEPTYIEVPEIEPVVAQVDQKLVTELNTVTYPLPNNFHVVSYFDTQMIAFRIRMRYTYDGKERNLSCSYSGNAYNASECAKYFAEQVFALFKKDFPGVPKQVHETFAKRLRVAMSEMMSPDYQYSTSPSDALVTELNSRAIAQETKKLPGMDYETACPGVPVPFGEDCNKRESLWSLVQHLNDTHKWTRERIADWLDGLHDEGLVNLEFEPWEEQEIS